MGKGSRFAATSAVASGSASISASASLSASHASTTVSAAERLLNLAKAGQLEDLRKLVEDGHGDSTARSTLDIDVRDAADVTGPFFLNTCFLISVRLPITVASVFFFTVSLKSHH